MRSRTPPCPGISDELSFTPAARFSRDSNKSPQMPKTNDQHAEHEQRSVTGEGQHFAPAKTMNAVPKMTPPIAPSIVFFGLIAGASGSSAEHAAHVVLRRIADDNRAREAGASRASSEAPGRRRACRAASRCRRPRTPRRRRPADRMIRDQHFGRHPQQRHQSATTALPASSTRTTTQHSATASTTARIGDVHDLQVLACGQRSDDAREDAQSDDGQQQDRRERNRHESDPADEANHAWLQTPVRGHLAPMTAGELMPPYRRSRF